MTVIDLLKPERLTKELLQLLWIGPREYSDEKNMPKISCMLVDRDMPTVEERREGYKLGLNFQELRERLQTKKPWKECQPSKRLSRRKRDGKWLPLPQKREIQISADEEDRSSISTLVDITRKQGEVVSLTRAEQTMSITHHENYSRKKNGKWILDKIITEQPTITRQRQNKQNTESKTALPQHGDKGTNWDRRQI